MLAVVQFPIADFRPLLDDNFAGRLPTPRWPPETSFKTQFVRGFGQAKTRLLGIDHAWTDEVAFCDASRALRLTQLPVSGLPWQRKLNCAFRRLLSDGLLVSRVEVGFSLLSKEYQGKVWKEFNSTNRTRPYASGSEGLLYQWNPEASPEDLLSLITSLPSIVGVDKKGNKLNSSEPVELIRQGKPLAKFFFESTSSALERPRIFNDRSWIQAVASASPVAIIECANRWFDRLPPNFVEISEFSGTGLRLALGTHQTPWGKFDVWWLGYDRARTAEIRKMRICLLRLHSEQNCLSLVLDRLKSGGILYKAGTESGDRLEAYLNRATRIIDRECWKGIDISQSKVLSAFDAIRAHEKHNVLEKQLASNLEGVRLQVRRKVELFELRSSRTINVFDHATYAEIHMNDSKTITIGAGATVNAPIVIADIIESSFTEISKVKENNDVKSLIEQILNQIVELSKVTSPEVSKELAENAESLSKEVARTTPRPKWYELSIEGLKDAAIAAGELGLPIINATSKLLPLLQKLWP